jgi:Ca2+/H+ antiporter, TMEM165/GDT1 family
MVAILAQPSLVITLAITVYFAVLLAELVGDKTLYTVGSLASTHHGAAVLLGAGVAVALKMAAAVMLGRVVADLPPAVVSVASAATFLAMAIGVWLSRSRPTGAPAEARQSWARGTSAAFFGIFLTEWGDLGQITTATLVAEYRRPWLVWACSSLAMLTKVTVAATFGVGFRRWAPGRVLRPIITSICLVMAALAAFRVDI